MYRRLVVLAGSLALITASAGSAAVIQLTGKSEVTTVHGYLDAFAASPSGQLYGVEDNPVKGTAVILRLGPTGHATVIQHVSGEIQGMAVDRTGDIYLSDSGPRDPVIDKLSPSGRLSVLVATRGKLLEPLGLAVDAKGNLYIADSRGERVWKVNPAGAISAFAGTGHGFYSTPVHDGGPATRSRLLNPQYVAVGPNGDVYISDNIDGRISRVDSHGIVTTVAGNKHGFSGDGGPAAKAGFGGGDDPTGSGVSGIAFDGSGNLWAAADYRIRKIDTRGIVTTVAGTGSQVTAGDHGPAETASFGNPGILSIAFGVDGTLYVNTFDGLRRLGPGTAKPPAPVGTTLKGAKTITFGITGTVTALSADGPLVAFGEETNDDCFYIHFWNPISRSSARGKDQCLDDPTSSSEYISLLALSGSNALWGDFDYGNHAYCTSETASPTKPAPADAGLCDDEQPDDVVGAIAGDGGSFAVNHWTACNGPCATGVDDPFGDRVSDVSLIWIDANGANHTIATGAQALVAMDVDAGRVLLALPGNGLEILSSSGKVLQTIPLQTARIRGAVLQGDDIVVQTSNELIQFSASSGKEIGHHGLPAGDNLSLSGIQSGIVVYTRKGAITLLRLSDGHSVTFTAGLTPVTATLSSAGLFYGYSEPPRNGEVGHVAFVRLADVERALS